MGSGKRALSLRPSLSCRSSTLLPLATLAASTLDAGGGAVGNTPYYMVLKIFRTLNSPQQTPGLFSRFSPLAKRDGCSSGRVVASWEVGVSCRSCELHWLRRLEEKLAQQERGDRGVYDKYFQQYILCVVSYLTPNKKASVSFRPRPACALCSPYPAVHLVAHPCSFVFAVSLFIVRTAVQAISYTAEYASHHHLGFLRYQNVRRDCAW